MAKAKTRLLLEDDYVAFDVETTGLAPSWCEVIEIGAVRVTDGDLGEEFHTFVRPTEPIPQFITELTGITDGMVSEAPSESDAVRAFLDFIGDSVLVAHNATFDERFMSSAMERSGLGTLGNDIVDTLRIARVTLPDAPSRSLSPLFELLHGTPLEGGHRAGADATAAAMVYEALKPKLRDRYGDDPEAGQRAERSARKSSRRRGVRDIRTTVDEVDESNPLFGMEVCFTGGMSMRRNDAQQACADLGAKVRGSVTKKLDYLIVGESAYRSGVNGGASKSLKAALERSSEPNAPQVIDENMFMALIEPYL